MRADGGRAYNCVTDISVTQRLAQILNYSCLISFKYFRKGIKNHTHTKKTLNGWNLFLNKNI